MPIAAVALLASCAQSARPPAEGGYLRGDELRAEPSKIVAAELAFARLAQDKGQWTAFADTSTGDAVMFVPQVTNAHQWLKGRANPPSAVTWQPSEVLMSCDGSLAVTKGPWQRTDSVGYFTTVWQRQRDGSYKWVLDQGDTLAQPLAAPEMIASQIGQCAARAAGTRPATELPQARIAPPACAPAGGCSGGGSSADGTLAYTYTVSAAGARDLAVQLRQDGVMREALRSQVAAR